MVQLCNQFDGEFLYMAAFLGEHGRQEDLRKFFELRKSKGESLSSMANQIQVTERTLREFLGNIDKHGNKLKRNLSAKNYNKIVSHYRNLTINLVRHQFGDLVYLLKDVSSTSIKWDFQTSYDQDEIKKFKDLRDFICKKAVIYRSQSYSLLEIINPPKENESLPVDPFEKHELLSDIKEKFDDTFQEVKIWAANYYSFLWKDDFKEVFIFMSMDKDNNLEEIINLQSDNLFDPKLMPETQKDWTL